MSTPEHDAFVARVGDLIKSEGLQFADPSAVASALLEHGESVFFQSDNAKLADKLHVLASRNPTLLASANPSVPTRKAHPDEAAFRSWLGKLEPEYDRMLPHKRIYLWDLFQSKKATLNAPTESDRFVSEMKAKHGEKWRDLMSPLEKMKNAQLDGSRTGRMSYGESLKEELVALKANIAHGRGWEFERARLRRIEILERQGVQS